MVKRLKWLVVSEKDLYELNDAFFYYVGSWGGGGVYESKLIDLAERFKSYAFDYGGRRYVFVSVKAYIKEGGKRREIQLAGFVVYDKSSRKILFAEYTQRDDVRLSFFRLMLRLAVDRRFNVVDALLSLLSRLNVNARQLLRFLGIVYSHLGDEFVEYLYRSYRDVVDRITKNKIVYGRNFVFLPMMDTILIRLNDGSIIAYELSLKETPGTVTESKEPLFYKFFSELIDYAGELDKSLVLYEKKCGQIQCEYYAFSSVSPPSWRGKYAVVFAGKFYRDLSGEEKFDEADIFFVECNGLCKMHSLRKALKHIMQEESEEVPYYRAYSIGMLTEKRDYRDYFPKFLEYVIGFRERLPPRFVDEAYEQYLSSGTVMNIAS